MIFNIILVISIISVYIKLNGKVNLLQKNYNKLCAVYVEALDQPVKLKELVENNSDRSLHLEKDFPLTHDELELIRSKCIKKLNKIKLGWDNNESKILGSYWDDTSTNNMTPYTVVKMKGTKFTYIVLPNKTYYFILDGKHKEFVKCNSLLGGQCELRKYQILMDSTESIALLNKIRKNN